MTSAVPNQEFLPCQKPSLPRAKNFSFTESQPPSTVMDPMPPDIDRLAVPTLVRGLRVVVKPCNPQEASSSRKLPRQPGRAAGPMPSKPFTDGR
jgi:hypothetical protein